MGATILTYHRVGGDSLDERDLDTGDFAQQLGELSRHDLVTLDDAIDRLDVNDESPCVVLTFDDGFADMHRNAWPMLRERRLPFTLYLSTSYVGGTMHWDGSTARAPGAALTWDQVAEMIDSGLCTVGNHTHRHVRPERLDDAELDECSDAIERHLGVTPRHFAFTWGVRVPSMDAALSKRFRTAATGTVGRNRPDTDRLMLRRVPVRRTDPLPFFRAKLHGSLVPERTYGKVVRTAKAVGAHA